MPFPAYQVFQRGVYFSTEVRYVIYRYLGCTDKLAVCSWYPIGSLLLV